MVTKSLVPFRRGAVVAAQGGPLARTRKASTEGHRGFVWLVFRDRSRLDAVMTTDEHARLMRVNQANWDARTPVHLASRFYGLDQDLDPERWFACLRVGRPRRTRRPRRAPPPVPPGHRDPRPRPARAPGPSASTSPRRPWRPPATSPRRRGSTSDTCGRTCTTPWRPWSGRRFDVVYTGKGALCYLPDLDRLGGRGGPTAASRRPVVHRGVPPAAQLAGPEARPRRGTRAAAAPRLPGRRRPRAPGRDPHLHRRTGRRGRHRQLRVDARNRTRSSTR